MKTNPFIKAEELLESRNDEEIEVIWHSILQGGLGDAKMINGIYVDDWSDLVYSELLKRRSK